MKSRQSLSTLLKKYNLQPRKGLGQNFLTDSHHLDKIVEAAELDPKDVVLEIGPGAGTLTSLLADKAGQVIAVEVDAHMVQLLKRELGGRKNLTIVEADVLQADIGALVRSALPVEPESAEIDRPAGYKVVANLPYYITSAVIRHLLEATPRPEQVVVTVQKEVAQRIVAQPGSMSVLAVSVQLYGRPELVHSIPAGAFYPRPKVDSAVVRINLFAELPVDVADVKRFFEVVKAGFGQKRKQLKNSLSALPRTSASQAAAALKQVGIDPSRRAETLSLEEWARLSNALT